MRLSKLPTPFAGVTLATFATANLLKSYSLLAFEVLSLLGCMFILLLALKFITNYKSTKEEMNNPVLGSVIGTFSMAIILMSAYLKTKGIILSELIWYFGITLHSLLIVWYTFKHVLPFNLKKIFPSIFIVYVGIATASVTAPMFNRTLGQYIFYFATVSFIILLPIVLLRVKNIVLPVPAKATTSIIAAPASLCLAGYLSAFETPNELIGYILLATALLLTVAVYLSLPSRFKMAFNPGFAAHTFPMVISAIAVKLASMKLGLNVLKPVVYIETIIAVIILLYVLFNYARLLTKKENTAQKAA
jgi:exfoliative toxin A/B